MFATKSSITGQYRVGRVEPWEVTGALDDLEPADATRQRINDLPGGLHRGDGVEFPDADERRAVDAGQLVDDIERA